MTKTDELPLEITHYVRDNCLCLHVQRAAIHLAVVRLLESARARLGLRLRLDLGRVGHREISLVLGHTGFDYLDETIALMRDFPSVYAEMSVLNSVGPRELHDASLRRLVEADLADRIVLGSDDQDYAPIVERIEAADFLTPEQRRGIYYDNAARFLRFDADTIARDYRR